MNETPEQAVRRLAATPLRNGFKPQALHEYQAADGTPLYWRIRLKRPADGEKWIRPMHANGAGFKIGEPPAPKAGKPLYHLPELVAADPGAPVFIVEGENCTEALAGLGIIATTSGSASSADAADWLPLQGRHCILWPDADEPGARYAEAVAGHLHALGCRVERVDISGLNLPEGGDVVDWLAQHPNATADNVSSIPRITHTKSAGDDGDTGDTLQHKGLSRPHDVPDTGDAGDSEPEGVEIIGKRKTPDGTPLPYFAFVLRKSGKYPGPGVYYIGQAIEGKEKAVVGHLAPQWVCSPLHVAAKTRDGSQSEWGRLLEFVDSDGHLHRWAMPCELLAGNGEELRRALLREGVTITTNRSVRPQLEIYLQTAKARTHARCVARTGWHGDVFVLPRETFGDTTAEPVLFQAASLDSVALSTSGDLAHWRANVAAPCAGNSRLVLALSMAFAGPCLGLLHAEGGGVHLRGSSSAGKSTALHVAASVYGLPEKYGKTWRATDNGLEGTAALHSDLLLILDEMGQLEPRHAGQVAYLLANGQGKARSHRDGSPRAVTTWRVLFLSAGEVGLDALVKEGGGRVQAGQQVRVVDVPADAGAGLGLFDTMPEGMTPGAYADGLKAAAAQYHGTALPAFLKELASDPGKYRDTLRALRDDIASRLVSPSDPGQVRRVADRFALIAAAGELATVLNLTGWSTGEAERAAAACFRAWLDARGTVGNAEPAAMLRQVRAFLEAHGEARFTRWDAHEDGARTINRAGYRRAGADGPTYFVETGAFRDEVCRGFDPRAVAKVLADAGALEVGGDGRDTRKMLLPDGRRARVYVVLPSLWGIEP